MAQARTAAASTTSSSSSSAMARLLRQTRLSTHDPSIAQVYTTPKANAMRGDWGLKLPIPPVLPLGKLRYVSLPALESLSGHVPWRERERGPLLRQRWLDAPPSHVSTEDLAAPKGPRIESFFDASTSRPLPATLREALAHRKAAYPIPVLTKAQEADPVLVKQRDEALRVHAQMDAYVARQSRLARYGLSSEVQPGGIGSIAGSLSSSQDPFGRAAIKYSTAPTLLPNYNTMSERQFARYLRTVRASRAKLHKLTTAEATARLRSLERKTQMAMRDNAAAALANARATGAPEPEVPSEEEIEKRVAKLRVDAQNVDLWDASRKRSTAAGQLRRAQSALMASKASHQGLPDSHVVANAGTSHPLGGLSYSQPDSIWTARLAEPQPGRVLQDNKGRGRGAQNLSFHHLVALGGRVGLLPTNMASGAKPLDFTRRDSARGTTLLRPVSAVHSNGAGSVLTKRAADDTPPTRVNIIAHVAAERDNTLLPPARVLPGSSDWVGAHDAARVVRNLGPSAASGGTLDWAAGARGRLSSRLSPSSIYTQKEKERSRLRQEAARAASGESANNDFMPLLKKRAGLEAMQKRLSETNGKAP